MRQDRARVIEFSAGLAIVYPKNGDISIFLFFPEHKGKQD